jgi:hypothetical protein
MVNRTLTRGTAARIQEEAMTGTTMDTAQRHPRGGLYFEDFVVGSLTEHRLRRTVTQII